MGIDMVYCRDCDECIHEDCFQSCDFCDNDVSCYYECRNNHKYEMYDHIFFLCKDCMPKKTVTIITETVKENENYNDEINELNKSLKKLMNKKSFKEIIINEERKII